MSSSGSNFRTLSSIPAPRRIIKEKKAPQESIYDEIDLGSEDINSIEEFHKNDAENKSQVSCLYRANL
jgi:hypothetical protein